MKSKTKEKAGALRKKLIFAVAVLCVAVIIYIAYNIVTSPGVQYRRAVRLMDKNVVKSYELLIGLDDYKDSAEKADTIYEEYKVEKLKVAKVGDYVYFGAYEQDNDMSNGKEIIEWLVLDKQDDKLLVISKDGLDCKKYNESYENVTWKDCTLRKWLNSTFMEDAFSTEEQSLIASSVIQNPDNEEFNIPGGEETTDQMFLLSIDEANQYFDSDRERTCRPTEYALVNDARAYSDGFCWWWLRSPGSLQDCAARVQYYGELRTYGYNVAYRHCSVRPAMWIELDTVK